MDFKHQDPTTLEFNRDPLVPFANTNEGPSISVCDVNKDSKDDIFIGGAKRQASALFLQDSLGKFIRTQDSVFEPDAISEDVSHVFFDANGDHYDDLLVDSKRYRFGGSIKLAKWVRNFIPKPELYIILTADADVIYQRKQEVPLEELKRQITEYRKLGEKSNYFNVDVNRTPENIVNEVVTLIMKKLNGRY